ncbi:MAG: hypothetical protein QGG40_00925 [Myxococcota bacterium]|jgi:hypothetical protein|nr:hypothetical protein [Myxococcota bacterium]
MRSLALVALFAGLPAVADESEAETCLRTKIWDGYNEGWAVRTATAATLGEGEHRVFLVTLYAGNDYKFRVCGDPNGMDLDLVLHDAQGAELVRDQTDDREPVVSYKPESTDTYYVAVYAAKLASGAKDAGVAMAVTYR